jgi:hypothetical protein
MEHISATPSATLLPPDIRKFAFCCSIVGTMGPQMGGGTSDKNSALALLHSHTGATAFSAMSSTPAFSKALAREVKRAEHTLAELEGEIANTRATTVEGTRAKIRYARAWYRHEIETMDGRCTEAMAVPFSATSSDRLCADGAHMGFTVCGISGQACKNCRSTLPARLLRC